MKKILVLMLCVIVIFSLVACGREGTFPIPSTFNSPEIAIQSEKPVKTDIPSEAEDILQITIGNHTFEATLYENETAKQFAKSLPQTINMSDLNLNEKYSYLAEGLPTNSQGVERINTGDIMLYGSNCLVLFYEDFTTNYSYTKIGKIVDVQEFAKALGKGDIVVAFRLK